MYNHLPEPPQPRFTNRSTHSYPVVSATDAKTSRVLLVIMLALHAGLAIAIKILFFAHGSPAAKGGGKLPDPMGDDDKGNAARMLMGL